MLKQTELIKSALNELGCEEAPSACDLSIENQSFNCNSSEQVKILNVSFTFKTLLMFKCITNFCFANYDMK